MKTSRILLFSAMLTLVFACSEKKESKYIIAPKPKPKVVAKPVKMQNYNAKDKVTWLGSQYEVTINRHVDESLPMVDAGNDSRYYDNSIDLTVSRQDGSVFFKKTFKKTDFSSQIDETYLKGNALLGLVYVKTEGDNLVFSASVGSPDALSDDYIPLTVKLSRMGSLSIQKDASLDLTNEDGDDGV